MIQNSIFQYLQYLRDSSKHLSVTGDLYKCLLQKNGRKKNTYHIQLNDLKNLQFSKNNFLYDIFIHYKDILKKESNKQVFLGLGTVFGKYNNKKIIFGTLINIPVQFNYSEDSREFTIFYDVDNKTINHDLLTALLPDFFDHDDSSSEELLSSIFYFEKSINNINNIENLFPVIANFINDFNLINQKNNITYNQLDNLYEKYDYEKIKDRKNKNSPLNKNKLYYSIHELHLFISQIPDNISTWKNLDNFCNDIKEENFNHPVLNELFNNVFHHGYLPEKSSS